MFLMKSSSLITMSNRLFSIHNLSHIHRQCRRFPFVASASQKRQFSSQHEATVSFDIGKFCEIKRTFSADDVRQFAQLTGDFNALHLDDTFAGHFNFEKAIVHGALINGIISASIGTILPGPGSILLEQDLHFPHPLYVGEEFVTKVTIANKKRNIYFCRYECTTAAEGTKVVYGMAKVLFQPSKLPK